MGKPYAHEYLNVEQGSRCGLMICGACNKPIVTGDFRAAQKAAHGDWHYVTHHRACCESDPAWARIEKRARDHHARNVELRTAAVAFRDQWGVTDLDELIDDLDASIYQFNSVEQVAA